MMDMNPGHMVNNTEFEASSSKCGTKNGRYRKLGNQANVNWILMVSLIKNPKRRAKQTGSCIQCV